MEDSSLNTNPSFIEEISLMMHGFGDSPTPNLETVQLVESIVKRELREMLNDITAKRSERIYKVITSEDIIFYFRHNKHKIQRLMKYIHFKYVDRKVESKFEPEYENKNKKSRTLYTSLKLFLEMIDETGELTDTNTFDVVKHLRNIRAEKISASLDEEKYIEYAKARNVSFSYQKYSQVSILN